MNQDEVERFEAYLTSQGITTQMILRQIVEAKEAGYVPSDENQFTIGSQGVEIGNPWVDAILCTNCIDTLVRVQGTVWEWWLAERAKGLQDRKYFNYHTYALLTFCSCDQSIARLLVSLSSLATRYALTNVGL